MNTLWSTLAGFGISGMNKLEVAKVVGKAGADFKRQFTLSSYQQFFAEAGYQNVTYKMIDGRVPCAVAVISLQ